MALPRSFKKSLWVFHVATGSCNGCDIEIVAALTPRYDTERFGIMLTGTPRHADVLLVTGGVTRPEAIIDGVVKAVVKLETLEKAGVSG
jgi:membrane-bound hydrogenase subunit mbhJ